MDGFLQFRGGPGPNETTFGIGLNAPMTVFVEGFGLFAFHAVSAKREGQFPTTAMR